ncbi:hypothetical protein HYPSUDRAFT_145626, partial [Hypholoma sublateritium FD-334 SS-4]
ITARDPLPDRTGRNVHPAPKKPTRRSTQEVETERKAKLKAIEDQIQAMQEAKRRLAEVNTLEDIHNNAMDEGNPQCLSVAIRKRGHQDAEIVDSDGEEAFDFREVDAMSTSESESESEGTENKKKGKAVKGAVRKEIQDMVERQHAEGDGRREKKKPRTTTLNDLPILNTSPRKYDNSGLRKAPKTKTQEIHDPFESGGLDDDDIVSVRPNFPPNLKAPGRPTRTYAFYGKPETSGIKRDHSQKNAVGFSSIINDERKSTTRQPKNTDRSVAAAVPVPSATGISNNNEAIINQILNDTRWRRVFLPTLAHAFYISREPFVDWLRGSPTFLVTVQHIFDLSFPNVYLALSQNNKITIRACSQMKSRKSSIGSNALEIVHKFFRKKPFAGNPEKIREYVLWALRPGGPAYYSEPTPQDCKAKPNQSGYIAPSGFLQSEFVLAMAKGYLPSAKNSVFNPALGKKHPPKGLYALILVVIERALCAYKNGAYIAPDKFDHDHSWKPLRDFFPAIDRVKEERWATLLGNQSGGSDTDLDDDARVDESMISAYRAEMMLVGSSPVKG